MRKFMLTGLLFTISAMAQKKVPAAQPIAVYGSVQGTVICTDTNLPARLTPVTLEPVRDHAPAREGEPRTAEPVLETFETRLDGSFNMPHVLAGKYYVIVQKPGYLSPAGIFTKAQIQWPSNPADDVSDAVAKSVPTVTVTANRGASIDLRLTRAAAISGVVKFDDGTPVPTQYITVQRKGPGETWLSTNLGGRRGNGLTDDLGRFRIAGVPPGEYRMYTALELSQVATTTIFGTDSSSSGSTKSSIRVYFGDTFHRKDAKIFKAEEGQEINADLVIPSAKLHAVSGSLVDARSGRTINAGKITLTFTDEKEGLISAAVDPDDPFFLLPFVPDGTYSVHVSDARDVTRVPVVVPEGTVTTEHYTETVVRTYPPYDGTLVVSSDLTGLVLQIVTK